MKTLNTILLAGLCLFYSCTPPDKKSAHQRSAADSLEIVAKATQLAKVMLQHAKDSAAKAQAAQIKRNRYYGPCPAAIKECQVSTDRHGKSIIVTLKNNSAKKIAVVGIQWVVYNKAGKRLGASSGKAKKPLAGGHSASYAWGINAATGTHAKASVYSILYKDGSVWLAGDGS